MESYKIDSQKLGKRVCDARQQKEMSQKQLSAAICIESGSLANIESGNSVPSSELLFAIAEALDTPVDYFLADSLLNADIAIDHMLFELFNTASTSRRSRLLAVMNTLISALEKSQTD